MGRWSASRESILASSGRHAPVKFCSFLQATLAGSGNLVGPGLYQFNLTIPDLADGDHAIIANVGGTSSPSTVFLSVAK
jgi:uncharacterized protein (TIGR03437 family)